MGRRKLRVAELFAGIGGVTGGLLDSGGFKSVFLSDSDEDARTVFAENFPGLQSRYLVQPIEKLARSQLLEVAGEEIDGILGCPPCQGFSAVGKRDSKDARNQLLHDFGRLVRSTRPKFFLMENVPALLESAYFSDLMKQLSSYRVCSQVINAAEYGVPQLRRRAVVLGIHRDLEVEPRLPEPTHGGSGSVYDYSTGLFVKSASQNGRWALQLRPKGVLGARDLVTLYDALADLPTQPASGSKRQYYAGSPTTSYQREMRRGGRGLFDHVRWNHRPETIALLRTVKTGRCPEVHGSANRNDRYFSQAYARLHRRGLARTITTNFHNTGSGRFAHWSVARALTIREALRVQSFPDSFVFGDSVQRTTAERLAGNAFPRLLARRLGECIRAIVS